MSEERHLTTTRRARYYVAGDVATAPELWIVIHGYGQLAREFLGDFGVLVDAGRAVIAPEALNRYYKETGGSGSHADTPVGTTWMTREHRDAEIADYVEYLDRVVATERRSGQQLGVIGFSQGVATAMRWVALGTARFDRVVAWAGQLPHDLDLATVPHRFPASGVEFVVGTRDQYREWIGSERQQARLRDAGLASGLTVFEGGHRMDDGALTGLLAPR